jgi:hypothetical protein
VRLRRRQPRGMCAHTAEGARADRAMCAASLCCPAARRRKPRCRRRLQRSSSSSSHPPGARRRRVRMSCHAMRNRGRPHADDVAQKLQNRKKQNANPLCSAPPPLGRDAAATDAAPLRYACMLRRRCCARMCR